MRLRDAPYICGSCRAQLRNSSPFTQQKRWISKNHIRKIEDAEKEWADKAAEIEAGRKKSMVDILEERGYINQIVGSRDDLNKLLTGRRVGVYAGVDPTASSLHIGHMLPFMALAWMYVHGYAAYFILGGFTARIGDPTGRLTGREAQARSTQKANVLAMHMQLKRLGASIERYAEKRGYIKEWAWQRVLLNNIAWWNKTPVMEFLRVMGTGVRLGPMLGRDT